jgi:ligand-binding sensor domain-containing protein
MTRKYVLFVAVATLLHGTAFAEERWSCFTCDGIVNDIAVAEPYLWCATGGGVVRWDTRDGSWIRFTCAEGLPGGVYWKNIARDSDGLVWLFATTPTVVMMFDGTVWRAPEDSEWRSKIRYPVAADRKGGTWACYGGSGVVWLDGDTHRIYTPADGLAGNQVTALAIDRNDGVWVGTDFGLSHFNGVEWITYAGENGPPGSDIRSIAVDVENVVWVVSNKGVFSLHGAEWKPLVLDGGFKHVVIGPNGVQWFATSAGGLKRFDGVSWTSYTAENSGMPDNYMQKIAIDGRGVLWLSCSYSFANFTGYGLTRFDGKTWMQWNTDGPVYNIMRSVAVDHDNVKWFGADIGVSCYDGVKWTNYQRVDGRDISGVYKIIVDKSNRKWFMGSCVMSYDGARWTVHTPDNTQPQVLDMTAYAADRSGREWFGTGKFGLWRRDASGWKNYSGADGLPGGCVQAVAVDRDNRVWVGTDQGLTVVDGDRLTRCAGGPDSLVTSIAVDSQNLKWVGTMKSGLWCFDGAAWKNYTKENSGLRDDRIMDVVVDGGDAIWLTVHGFRYLQHLSGTGWARYDSGPGTAQVLGIAVGPDNMKWLATWGGGVLALETDAPSLTRVTTVIPPCFMLIGSYPNPFNASTVIRFSLDREVFTDLRIYNSAGQQVRRLIGEVLAPGEHAVWWDGKDERGAMSASGLYFARFLAHRQTQSIKLLLLK